MFQYKSPNEQYTINLSICKTSYSFTQYNSYVSMEIKDILGVPICKINMPELDLVAIINMMIQFENLDVLSDRHCFVPDINGCIYSILTKLEYDKYCLSCSDIEHPEDDEAERYLGFYINRYNPAIKQDVTLCHFNTNVYEFEDIIVFFWNFTVEEGEYQQDIDYYNVDDIADFIIRKRQEIIIM